MTKTKIIVHTIILNQKNEILFLKRVLTDNNMYGGFWDIPGGSLDFGEDPSQGACRETLEETGLKINARILQLVDYTSNVDTTKNTQFIRMIFLAKLQKQAPVMCDPKEHSEYIWGQKQKKIKLVPFIPKTIAKIKTLLD